ncbi:MAG TPA: sodium:proton antiporter [Candidatus Hydrogenedentes bacterium]|nr:sodium:proton antiporter [Candidatus Hydrogenedentota bacterium]
MVAYVMCMALLGLGIYCVLMKRNLIKIIVGLVITEYAINLFFVLISYRKNGLAPIFAADAPVAPETMVDPLPQALVLTAIVIGLATTALIVALAMRLYEKYGTFDIAEIRELKG